MPYIITEFIVFFIMPSYPFLNKALEYQKVEEFGLVVGTGIL